MQNENEFTTPDGAVLTAVPTKLIKIARDDPSSACRLCYFKSRAFTKPHHCWPDTLPPNEPKCGAHNRLDKRDIYWKVLRPPRDPNPL